MSDCPEVFKEFKRTSTKHAWYIYVKPNKNTYSGGYVLLQDVNHTNYLREGWESVLNHRSQRGMGTEPSGVLPRQRKSGVEVVASESARPWAGDGQTHFGPAKAGQDQVDRRCGQARSQAGQSERVLKLLKPGLSDKSQFSCRKFAVNVESSP